MIVIPPNEEQRIPILNWAEGLELGALQQAGHLAQLPFAFHHVAIMPDGHVGYGMPIGGVLATVGVVIPAAVGYDIGCGVLATRSNLLASEISQDQLKQILALLRGAIPVGPNHHKISHEDWLPIPVGDWPIPTDENYVETLRVCMEQYESAALQVGTLGSGNHFLEIQRSVKDDHVWFMIHSGSRNLGHKVASYYVQLAKDLNAKWHTGYPAEWDLAFLPSDSDEGRYYLGEMAYCVQFAVANREYMAAQVREAILSVFSEAVFEEPINIAHNYAELENHYGKNVFVHRKGATRARFGDIGVIPGSQGTASYIVRGLGNPKSFMSCSHGAGRRHGRKEAQRLFGAQWQSIATELESKGIVHSIRGASSVDEAPQAYKDIDEVMRAQQDLVEIVEQLQPMAVMKG